MLRDGGSDPGMRQLQQQRAAGAEKDDGLPVDLPGHRVRAEHAGNRSRGVGADLIEGQFQIVPGYQLQGLSKADDDRQSAGPAAIR
ncbi:hypothetical protein ACVWXN_005630 [Bradyrhizobium sp. i1.4.4]